MEVQADKRKKLNYKFIMIGMTLFGLVLIILNEFPVLRDYLREASSRILGGG